MRYCSRACARRKVNALDRQLELAILDLLKDRRPGASICPSEIARGMGELETWRELMEPVRRAARRLALGGRVRIVQKGRTVDPGDFRGPIRIRACDR